MRIFDLVSLAGSNLLRRKTRSILTILGVIIGTASIVVMLSLGLGMSRMLLESYQNYGSLTMINVVNWSWTENDSSHELTDECISNFSVIPHVIGTSPALSVNVTANCGAYTSNYEIVGVSQDYFSQLTLKSGEIPKPDQGTLSLVYGNTATGNFYKKNDWANPRSVDPETETIFYQFPDASNIGSIDSPEGNTSTSPAKKYILQTSGVLAGEKDAYSETSMRCYADIDTFKRFLKKIYKKNLVPNPKTNKKGKALRYYVYDSAYVFVDSMENVTDVQKIISDQGFTCYSNMEWLKQAQQTMGVVQMVLGGIGAVSLLVAAIGIMNTMMMSIYERTREIGVMKVLGCDMGDIRNMFLCESAMIGFLGGTTGVLLSYGISGFINMFLGGGESMGLFYFGGGSNAISYIPHWLAAFAILFAVVVGSLSGYVPSVRAMKLSALTAIRND